jgi:hypothetical protein
LDPGAGPEGFHPQAHRVLRRARELIPRLEQQVRQTEEAQPAVS